MVLQHWILNLVTQMGLVFHGMLDLVLTPSLIRYWIECVWILIFKPVLHWILNFIRNIFRYWMVWILDFKNVLPYFQLQCKIAILSFLIQSLELGEQYF